MVCPNCKKVELKGKQQYCSDRCRIAYTRSLRKGAEPEHLPEQTQTEHPFKLTRTDRQFEKESPGYYDFSHKVHDKECFMCSTQFKTRLQLLKFCSLKCKRDFYKVMDTRTYGGSK